MHCNINLRGVLICFADNVEREATLILVFVRSVVVLTIKKETRSFKRNRKYKSKLTETRTNKFGVQGVVVLYIGLISTIIVTVLVVSLGFKDYNETTSTTNWSELYVSTDITNVTHKELLSGVSTLKGKAVRITGKIVTEIPSVNNSDRYIYILDMNYTENKENTNNRVAIEFIPSEHTEKLVLGNVLTLVGSPEGVQNFSTLTGGYSSSPYLTKISIEQMEEKAK